MFWLCDVCGCISNRSHDYVCRHCRWIRWAFYSELDTHGANPLKFKYTNRSLRRQLDRQARESEE